MSTASDKVFNDERQAFLAIFPDIVRELTDKLTECNCSLASKWFAKVLEYNVQRGKNNSGLMTVLTFKKLCAKDQLTPHTIRMAQYIGWCIEMVSRVFTITDDIMDKSLIRHGQACWHKRDDVGLIAINDALMIENGVYVILKKHFRHTDYYSDLLDLFHEGIFIIIGGQSLDLLTANKDVASFTMDNYKSIAGKKSAAMLFYYPFAVAMLMAGFRDAGMHTQAKMILCEIGHLFQAQNDFLDCFGEPNVTGQIGTDIQDNKCSWLAVVCMQQANDAQKKIMTECYGQNDPEKIDRVKELYMELDLPNVYATYEKETYNMIKAQIEQTSDGFPSGVFLQFLNKIYNRDV